MKKDDYPSISVVLNAFKRTDFLALQLDAIEGQTIKPSCIFVWQNKGNPIDENLKSRFTLAECSDNLGVWARFAYALNLDTDYICIFDDDAIPGERWFENCVNTLRDRDGLLGTRGIRYMSSDSYRPFKHYGWGNPSNKVVQVDIVGHSWFFKREYLAYFWSEMPPVDASKTAGEDMHFSYMLQKYGIGTYVPAHPENDMSLWGSLPEYGRRIGEDENGISSAHNAMDRFDIALRYYTNKGFQIYLQGPTLGNGKALVVVPSLRRNTRIIQIVKKNEKFKSVAKWTVRQLEKIGIYV